MLKRQLQKSNPGEQMGAKSISNDKMSKSNYSELNNSKSKSPESVYMLVHLLGKSRKNQSQAGSERQRVSELFVAENFTKESERKAPVQDNSRIFKTTDSSTEKIL